jgi:hypothetical protein
VFFNIDADDGAAIGGWLAPDNPSAVPKILVRRPGEEDIEISATIQRPDVRDLGVHATGLVGFLIDDKLIQGLPGVEDIELLEADTGILIYRRFKKERHIERKFFLFDGSIRPIEKLGGRSRNLFTLTYPSTERYAFETMLVLSRHVPAALENLASMELVGVRSRFRDFSALLAGILGHDLTGDYEPVAHPSISALADRLSRISLVADLLEADLALYSFAEESVLSALSDDADVVARDTQTM